MKWKDQVVLVTGGTGSFGKKFIEIMLQEYQPAKIIVFSRDELKQHEMRASGFHAPNLRYFIGCTRPGPPAPRLQWSEYRCSCRGFETGASL